jgi:hypothetical protein
MTLEQFRNSLGLDHPPSDFDYALAGLWWDAKGDWVKAHESAQADESSNGAWVHAYLHRKEGDATNAGYWYRRAHRTPSSSTFQEEWQEITRSLLERAAPDS